MDARQGKMEQRLAARAGLKCFGLVAEVMLSDMDAERLLTGALKMRRI